MFRGRRSILAEQDLAEQDLHNSGVIYLDYHATTPCDPRVVDTMSRCLKERFGNPSSPHFFGKAASGVVENARQLIADYIGAMPGELVFTSGATESNNLAVVGIARAAANKGNKRHKIFTSSIEHKSVLKAAEIASSQYGLEHEVIPVDSTGVVDLGFVKRKVDSETLLISVQAVNNEIGTIQPVKELAEIAYERGALVHCDAAQALGRLPLDVKELGADLLSLSAHKAYGPKGIGLLYLRGGRSRIPVEPVVYGGGQERGLRPGTLNVPAIAGFAKAVDILTNELQNDVDRFRSLRDLIEQQITCELEFAKPIVKTQLRVASTSNIHLKGVEADALLARLPNVAVSTASACEAGALEPSHVLQSLGVSRQEAYECIRIAVGRFTTEEAARTAANRIVQVGHEISNLVRH